MLHIILIVSEQKSPSFWFKYDRLNTSAPSAKPNEITVKEYKLYKFIMAMRTREEVSEEERNPHCRRYKADC